MKDPLGIKINSIPVLYKLFPNEEACINYLVTFNQNGTPISLFDKTSKVYKLKNGNYRCKNHFIAICNFAYVFTFHSHELLYRLLFN